MKLDERYDSECILFPGYVLLTKTCWFRKGLSWKGFVPISRVKAFDMALPWWSRACYLLNRLKQEVGNSIQALGCSLFIMSATLFMTAGICSLPIKHLATPIKWSSLYTIFLSIILSIPCVSKIILHTGQLRFGASAFAYIQQTTGIQ